MIELNTFTTNIISIFKLYLQTYVYKEISNFNTLNDIVTAVLGGGSSIKYYINDIDIPLKDFDIKICKKDLEDWKSFKSKGLLVENTNEYIKDILDLSIKRKEFINSLISVLHTSKSPFIKFLKDMYNIEMEDIELSYYFEDVKLNIKDEVPKEYENIKKELLLLDNSNFPRVTIVIHFIYYLKTKLSKVRYGVKDEALFDIGLWSPLYLDENLIEGVKNKNIELDKKEYSILPIDNSIPYGFINRNFSYVRLEDNFCIVTISYLIWDTVRMLCYSYSNNSNSAYEKYAKKYWLIIESLFNKLKCVSPFIDACSECSKDISIKDQTYYINNELNSYKSNMSSLFNNINTNEKKRIISSYY